MDQLIKRQAEIVRTVHQALLKGEGFRRRGRKFARENAVIHVVEFYGSPWNSRDERKFDVGLDLGVPGYFAWFGRPELDLKTPRCPISISLRFLLPKCRTWSFIIRIDDEVPDVTDALIAARIVNELKEFGLSFFARYQSISDLIQFLETFDRSNSHFSQPQTEVSRLFSLGVLYGVNGDMKRGLATVKRAYDMAGSHGPGHFFSEPYEVLRQKVWAANKEQRAQD